MVNWKIARNPINWIIVLLMFYIGVFGVKIVADFVASKREV